MKYVSKKFWLCMVWCVWLAVQGVVAQPADGLCRLEEDSLWRQEFEAMCYRQAAIKRAAAEQLKLDTLPVIRESLEAYRAQWLARLVQPLVACADSVEQVRILQIFNYLPQNVTAARWRRAEQQMDSLSRALGQGADFGLLVQQFSDDREAHWVARLEVPEELEAQAFRLQPGEVSQPFYTPQGLHIIQVLERRKQPADASGISEVPSARFLDDLKERLAYEPHRASIRQVLRRIVPDQPLFTLQGEAYTAADWALFIRSYPARPEQQFRAFLAKSLLDRAARHLEQVYPDAQAAVSLYRDSLLAHEWTRYQWQLNGVGGEAPLQAYFDQHRSDYRYDVPRFEGVIIQAVSKKTARQVRKFFRNLPLDEWSEAVRLAFASGQHPEVQLEAGIFARGDDPWVDHHIFRQKEPVPSPSFPVVLVMGEKLKGPRSMEEVRREVIRDYLARWEERWMKHFRQQKRAEEAR